MTISAPDGIYELKVLRIKHYTDRLFAFDTERPQAFRFRSGEFAMIAMPVEKPIYRAYSVASPSWDETLEFFSIKVPDGPLTSLLQKIQPGDKIWMRRKATGTLVLDALKPKKRLFLFSTGTGIAPFASVIRDPETYEKFDSVYLTHTCRTVAELAYGQELIESIKTHEILADIVGGKLHYFGSTTREEYENRGRITDLLKNGEVFEKLGIEPLNAETDAAMICGTMAFLKELQMMLIEIGLEEGSNARPADFVIEKAFVE